MKEFSPNVPTHSSTRDFPREAGQWRSFTLAALVHVVLIAFLWVGVQWQNKETTAVEAEVWDMTTRQAAPKPIPEEEVQPEPEKIAPPVAPTPVVKDEPVVDPEIALAQEKKRLLVEKKKIEDQKKAELQEVKLKQEQELALKKAKEKLAEEKKKADKLLADEAEKKKLADSKAQSKTQQNKEQAARDKVFEENMRRLNGQAAVTGTGGTGDAPKSTGNNRGDPSYAARIASKVRQNTVFNAVDNSNTNPTVEYRIDLLPDGSLRGPVRKLKSSGAPGFDEAVEKGIEKSAPFPRDKSGDVPTSIVLSYKMKE
ncbi:colicin import membrane protein [Undibacterium sp. GrIS 1.8]|uniref:cell envelope integrity protein TolA n=1 Tax=Undibacterium sp. GrIS 1.8 TaxID=3143934 RepID=UPI0033926B02